MINVYESKQFFVVKDTVVSDTVWAKDKDEARDIEISERGVYDMNKRKIYDIDEFYDVFGYYPYDFYVVVDGKAVDFTNAKDRESARKDLGCTPNCEVLSHEEFVDKYNHDPLDDVYDEPVDEYR